MFFLADITSVAGELCQILLILCVGLSDSVFKEKPYYSVYASCFSAYPEAVL
jgi:hypothetical protein